LAKFAASSIFVSATVAAQAPWPMPKEDYGGAKPRNLEDWYSYADYPDKALGANEQGYVTVSFTIGVDGRMTDCKVIRSSGYALLDAVPCNVLPKRARFKPAKDAQGTPIVTHGTTSMAFYTKP
jgi:protein TonB